MGLAVVVDSDELAAINSKLSRLEELVTILLTSQKPIGNNSSRLMSIPAAAEEIGIDKRTLIKAMNDGLIKVTPTSNTGQKRFHPDEVQRFKCAYQDNTAEIRRGRKPASNFATN